jgi:AP2 domain
MNQKKNFYWQNKFESFEVIGHWISLNPISEHKKLNIYRMVQINDKLYEVQCSNKHEITFLCDLKDFDLLKSYTWYCNKIKNENIYYIKTGIKNNNKTITKQFHRMKNPEWSMTDHINRERLDNRSCNLREATSEINNKNRNIQKNNKSGFNGVYYHKRDKKWGAQWLENKKQKFKYFKNKEEAINYRKEIDKKFNINNGYDVIFR